MHLAFPCLFCCWWPIGLLLEAFWIWMIVDCMLKEPDGSDKIAWVLLFIFTNVLGAAIYFFARKLPRDSGKSAR